MRDLKVGAFSEGLGMIPACLAPVLYSSPFFQG